MFLSFCFNQLISRKNYVAQRSKSNYKIGQNSKKKLEIIFFFIFVASVKLLFSLTWTSKVTFNRLKQKATLRPELKLDRVSCLVCWHQSFWRNFNQLHIKYSENVLTSCLLILLTQQYYLELFSHHIYRR